MFKEIIHPCSSQSFLTEVTFCTSSCWLSQSWPNPKVGDTSLQTPDVFFLFHLPHHSFVCTQSKDRDQLSSLTFCFHNFSVSFHVCSSWSTPPCASYILLQISVRDLLLPCVVKCLRQWGCPSCPPGCCLSMEFSSFLPFLLVFAGLLPMFDLRHSSQGTATWLSMSDEPAPPLEMWSSSGFWSSVFAQSLWWL